MRVEESASRVENQSLGFYRHVQRPFCSFRLRSRSMSCAPFVINGMSQNESSEYPISLPCLQVDHCSVRRHSNRISSVVVKSLARLTNLSEIESQPSNERQTKYSRYFHADRSTNITLLSSKQSKRT